MWVRRCVGVGVVGGRVHDCVGTVEEWEGSRAWHKWSADASVPNSLRGPCSMGIRTIRMQSVITAREKKIRRKQMRIHPPPHT